MSRRQAFAALSVTTKFQPPPLTRQMTVKKIGRTGSISINPAAVDTSAPKNEDGDGSQGGSKQPKAHVSFQD